MTAFSAGVRQISHVKVMRLRVLHDFLGLKGRFLLGNLPGCSCMILPNDSLSRCQEHGLDKDPG